MSLPRQGCWGAAGLLLAQGKENVLGKAHLNTSTGVCSAPADALEWPSTAPVPSAGLDKATGTLGWALSSHFPELQWLCCNSARQHLPNTATCEINVSGFKSGLAWLLWQHFLLQISAEITGEKQVHPNHGNNPGQG